jgi:hypothetical protein
MTLEILYSGIPFLNEKMTEERLSIYQQHHDLEKQSREEPMQIDSAQEKSTKDNTPVKDEQDSCMSSTESKAVNPW